MADSIDRVFAHALQTVRKLPRTGSARPPTQDRLRLYGLYKQSMEGDVEGVMARPAYDDSELASSAEARAELEKWEAWSACAGLTRTQAKTRYIDTLIATMHAYASGTTESRGLVQELEFVWDQVRSNAAAGGLVEEEREQRERGRRRPSRRGAGGSSSRSGRRRRGARRTKTDESGLRVLRPMSEDAGSSRLPEDEDDEDDDDEDGDDEDDRSDGMDDEAMLDDEATREQYTEYEDDDYSRAGGGGPISTRRWQGRMEHAVVRLTAEVAAVREQLDGANHSLWTVLGGGLGGGGGSSSDSGRGRGGRNGSGRDGGGSGAAAALRPWLRFLARRIWLLLRRMLADALTAAMLLAIWRLWRRWRHGEREGPVQAVKREVGAVREGVEMLEAWIGFWWRNFRRSISSGGSQ